MRITEAAIMTINALRQPLDTMTAIRSGRKIT